MKNAIIAIGSFALGAVCMELCLGFCLEYHAQDGRLLCQYIRPGETEVREYGSLSQKEEKKEEETSE